MGYVLVLTSRCGSHIGNLHSPSLGASYTRFAYAWHNINSKQVTKKNNERFDKSCHSFFSMSSLIGSRKRNISDWQSDVAFNMNLNKLQVHQTSSWSSVQQLGCNYSAHLLRNRQYGEFVLQRSQLLGPQHCRQQQYIHTSAVSLREESKVEETLEALKTTIKESAAAIKKTVPSVVSASPSTDVAVPAAPVKKSIGQRIIAELKHYYHGFRLLYIDVKVCARLIWQVLKGRPLMRREQKQLVRTTADLFRLVPFLVIILIPFAEFALPILLKVFPGMLPSTFKEENTEMEKRKKRLKIKLEMAKFLQDTIEETALTRKDGTGESVHDFVKFIEKIRTSGEQTSNEEILKFSKLFEDEITLDNLSYDQLRALCRLVEVPTVGTSYLLRFQIEMKLRQLEADDQVIQKEGVESMAVWELQEACRARAMRSFGVSEQRLKTQLNQWLDLHLNHQVPTSLLLLSRTLYLPEHLSPEDQLRATLSALPAEAMAEEAKVKILEVTGDRVDNKSKLKVIKQEEEIIQREKEELEKEEQSKKKEAAMAESAKAKTTAEIALSAKDELLVDKAPVLGLKEHAMPAPVPHKIAEIDTEDLNKIEDLLDHVVASKKNLKKEVEELEALKEDLIEYQENLEDVTKVVKSSGGALPGLTESKAAQLLSRKVGKMIEQMDEVVKDLKSQKISLLDDIKAKEAKQDSVGELDATSKHLLEEISQEQDNLIHINELLQSINKLQHVPDSSKLELIAQVLDEDKDGMIDYNEAVKVIELLGTENLKLNAEQMTEIMSVLRKEKIILKAEKQQKQEERKQQQQQEQQSIAADNESAQKHK